jgi:uncharacterized protein YbaA (DUF1428 family)
MARYVDGFVLVVPKKRVAEYKKMARGAGKIWRKYGALAYRECMLDHVKPQWITFTFPKMAKAKPSETVWFSYIEYKSKKHRNQVNAKVMRYMEKKYGKDADAMKNMPFDMKRMAYGGFTVEVSA